LVSCPGHFLEHNHPLYFRGLGTLAQETSLNFGEHVVSLTSFYKILEDGGRLLLAESVFM